MDKRSHDNPDKIGISLTLNWYRNAQSIALLQGAGQDAPPTDAGHSEIGQKTEN